MFALTLAAFVTAAAPDWKPAPVPLMTKWGKQVTPENAWPEYPRPQLVRKDWQNLNGLWDYAITPKDAPKPEKWDGKILVPFCAESALSGVGKHPTADQNLWYRRAVEVPAGWKGKRVLLHFGAVDWESTVFVNGKELLTHKGGNTPFSVDVTDALQGGKGELVVRVWDPTDARSQPRGKQVTQPGGIWYTAVTGIWQTVWLEPVPETHITRVVFTPDIDKGEVECLVEGVGAGREVIVFDKPAGDSATTVWPRRAAGQVGKPFRFAVENPKLWSPDSPHLHTVKVGLTDPAQANTAVDLVESYFAYRKTGVAPGPDGNLRLMLNNQPVFQLGPLDQGWWPDGLLTPPSDAALRYDVEVLRKLGFNMLRKHIKVEPARFYRHCDELGMLVWQDQPSGMIGNKKGGEAGAQHVMPGGKQDVEFNEADKKQFRAELKAMIDHLRGFGCIVVWVPFNEGWGQHDTNDILKWVKQYDPSRPVNGPSGWEDRGYGDLKDMHAYPGPDMFPPMKDRATVLGEFGGLGLPVPGHLWQDKGNWGYQTFTSGPALARGYRALLRRLHPLIPRGLSAAVYTQTTDVEVEVNGLMTYDREVIKLDPATVAGWHAELAGPPPTIRVLVPASGNRPQTWQYTFDKPTGDWHAPDYQAGGWQSGPGQFGTKGTPNVTIRTVWNTPDIWLRREFELAAVPSGEVYLRMHHDDDAEVYLNGVLAVKANRWTSGYSEFPLTPEARKALKAGKNLIAVHCHQEQGGQVIDAGLEEVIPAAGAGNGK